MHGNIENPFKWHAVELPTKLEVMLDRWRGRVMEYIAIPTISLNECGINLLPMTILTMMVDMTIRWLPTHE